MKALLSALVIALSPAPALACSCVRPGPNAPRPEIVVKAEVMKVERAEAGVAATLRVIRPVTGRTARRIVVFTAGHPAACGVEFTAGMVDTFALSRFRGRYSANSCMQFLMKHPR